MNYEECAAALLELGYDPIGCCAEFTAAFAMNFPELKRVYGFVTLRSGLRCPHWWLERPDGTIFDPTSSQFEQEFFWYAGIAFYEKCSDEELVAIAEAEKASGMKARV